jgi:hypothetical protein
MMIGPPAHARQVRAHHIRHGTYEATHLRLPHRVGAAAAREVRDVREPQRQAAAVPLRAHVGPDPDVDEQAGLGGLLGPHPSDTGLRSLFTL